MKILCVEDDRGLAALLGQVLIEQHYRVELATDGQTGWNLAEIETYDLILLDWILPELTGIEFCRRLRTRKRSTLNPNHDTPVLLMTAIETLAHKVMALNAGADDYVVKPFHPDELLARIRALLRRERGTRDPLLRWGEICLNPNNCEVSYSGRPIALAAKEYELLELLLRNPGQIFSPDRLLTALWTVDDTPGEGTIRAHIKGLRQKLKRAGAGDPIETLYKLGYRLKPPIEDGDDREVGEISIDVSSSPSPPSPVAPELREAWEEARPLYLDRLSIVRSAMTALRDRTLTVEQREIAERESHTLIGSLGSFGLEEASRLARQIQRIFQRTDLLEPSEIETLSRSIDALRLYLEQLGDGRTEAIDDFQNRSTEKVGYHHGEEKQAMTSRKRYKVLIIDDSPEDRATYRRYLQRDDRDSYEILEADSGESALEICRNSPPDAILLDYLLPDTDGLELLESLVPPDAEPRFPVLMLTGQGNETIAVRALKNGARDYLVKGNLTAELLQKSVAGEIERFGMERRLIRQGRQQQILTEMTINVRRSLDFHEILQTTVDETRRFLQVDRVIIFQFTPGWGGEVAVESVGDESLALFPLDIHDPCIGEQYVEPFRQGSVTAKADIYNADISPCHVEFLANLQVRANLVVPILRDDELWGLLAAHHCTATREWEDFEIDLLRQIATGAGIALQQAELFGRLQAELKERERAEAALREREELLRLFARYAPAGIAMFDRQMRYLLASQGWVEQYHLDAIGSLIGRSHYEIFPDLPERWREVHRRCLAGAIVKQEDDPFPRADGIIQWQSWEVRPWYSENGEIGGIIIFSVDVTSRKQVEESLRQSEARLRLAQAAGQSATWDWDIRTNKLVWSPEFYRLYDLDPTVEPNYETWTRCVHPDDRERASRQTLQTLQDGSSDVNVEFRVLYREEIRWFAGRGQVLRDENGEPLRMIGITIDITGQKQVELELQRLNNELERRVAERTNTLEKVNDRLRVALAEQERARQEVEDLYNHAPCGYHSLDATGTIVRINDTELGWLGYTRDEVIGKMNYLDALLPDGQRMFRENFPRLLQEGRVHNLEFQLRHRDGSSRWVSLSSTAIKDGAGNFLRSRSSLFDISDRKQAEAVVQQQAKLERLRWQITTSLRRSLDLDAILEAAVERVRETLEVDRVAVYRFAPDWSGDFIVESVGENWVKLVDSGVRKIWEDTHLQETRGGRFREGESFAIADIRTAGLQPCHIELLEQFQARAQVVAPIGFGETLWGLLAIYQNTGARDWQTWEVELLQEIAGQLAIAIQQAELYGRLQSELQERSRTEAVLREAERRWRSLLDNVQLVVIGLDILGNVEYANPFFLQLTGYSIEEVIGDCWFDRFLPSERVSSLRQAFREILENDNPHPHYRNSILTRAGEERLIAWNNTILRDTAGAIVGTISIGEDITERNKIDRMKAEFISVVSHELRTPLTSMQAALELLDEKIIDPVSEEGEAAIQIAAEGTERLVRLVNDILDLERLESGKIRLQKRFHSVDELINTAVAQMREMANREGIRLETDFYPARVEVDADRLLQVLTNLLSNAIKFSPRGSIVRVSVEGLPTAETPSFLLFTVRDNGRGIPADKLESIFERFGQVDSSDSREKGGTGLGLAICRSIVRQHGGEIRAESTPGGGSVFSFTIPISGEENRETWT